MKKIILIAYALTCTASLYAGHSKELKLTSPYVQAGENFFFSK